MPNKNLLPETVTERLADTDTRSIVSTQRGEQVETRKLSKVEMRTDDDGNLILDGYATVYDYAYDVAGGAPYGWSETIASGAAKKSVAERDDVRLLVNHDGIPLARTKSKTMTLESDDIGLRVSATLDPQNPTVQEVRSAMERGDMDEMSFAFQVIRQEWNADYTQRSITELKLFDVSVVTYPANPATVAQLRDMKPETEQLVSEPARTFSRSKLAMEADRLRLAQFK